MDQEKETQTKYLGKRERNNDINRNGPVMKCRLQTFVNDQIEIIKFNNYCKQLIKNIYSISTYYYISNTFLIYFGKDKENKNILIIFSKNMEWLTYALKFVLEVVANKYDYKLIRIFAKQNYSDNTLEYFERFNNTIRDTNFADKEIELSYY